MNDFGQSVMMSDQLSIGITPAQQELILRGLRFVRSSVLLRTNDEPDEEDRRQRDVELRAVEDLINQLDGAAAGV